MELFIKIWPILTWVFVAIIILPSTIFKDNMHEAKFLRFQIILLIIQLICSIIYFINI